MSLCWYVYYVNMCVQWGQQRALGPYELELKTVVSSHVGPGNWPEVSLEEEEMFFTTEPQTES